MGIETFLAKQAAKFIFEEIKERRERPTIVGVEAPWWMVQAGDEVWFISQDNSVEYLGSYAVFSSGHSFANAVVTPKEALPQ